MLSIEQIAPENTWRLRRDVMYPGHKMFEMELEDDPEGIHFGAFMDDKHVGVISLFQKGTDFQFRKLAVDPMVRNRGIGSRLLKQVIDHAKENGGTRMWCNARDSAFGFYLKHGFCQTGESFSKNGHNYGIMEKAIE
jgi:ribosomal protein S18 acetylase RimI-like enzyme